MEHSLEKNRIAIFVDGANLFKSAREQRIKLDYGMLKRRLAGDREVVLALYFGSYKREPLGPEETTREEAFEAMVREAGFELRLRPLKAEPFGMRVPRVRSANSSGTERELRSSRSCTARAGSSWKAPGSWTWGS